MHFRHSLFSPKQILTFRKTLCAGVVLLLSSCYDEPTVPGRTILLTQGTWVRTAWASTPPYRYTYSNGTTGTFSNLFDLYAPCRHDDEYIFFDADPTITTYTRGNYLYKEGTIACGTENTLESCTFFMQEEQGAVKIYFELPGSEPLNYKIKKIYTVEQLTPTTLIFSYKVQSGNTVHVWQEFYKRK